MIRDNELRLVGRFNKPHGVCGEISASLLYDGLGLGALRCVVVKIDGINVPFFIASVRPKGPETVLLKIDGYDSDEALSEFLNKDFYALASELDLLTGGDDEGDEGLYAADLVGFDLFGSDGTQIGRISGLEDSTANVLFIVSRPDGPDLLIPVADDFITEIDTEGRYLTMDLPEGLLHL